MTRNPPQNLAPFRRISNAESAFHTRCADYGLRPDATKPLGGLARTLGAALLSCAPHTWGPAAKAALRGYLCEPGLLSAEQCCGSADGYRRHLLYVSPDKRFSIMSIVWQPGQRSPVHGHTAWGAVGVFSGRPFCENYAAAQSADGTLRWQQLETVRLKPLDLAVVEPGLGTIHRIGNDGISPCITIHIYGRDLLANPSAINFFVAD